MPSTGGKRDIPLPPFFIVGGEIQKDQKLTPFKKVSIAQREAMVG